MASERPSADSVSSPSDADWYSPEIAYSVVPLTMVVVCGSSWSLTIAPEVVISSSVIGAAWSRL
jgi:hypothetical protein